MRRLYRSPRRSEQARETRERVVAAAAEEFVRAGYAATTSLRANGTPIDVPALDPALVEYFDRGQTPS